MCLLSSACRSICFRSAISFVCKHLSVFHRPLPHVLYLKRVPSLAMISLLFDHSDFLLFDHCSTQCLLRDKGHKGLNVVHAGHNICMRDAIWPCLGLSMFVHNQASSGGSLCYVLFHMVMLWLDLLPLLAGLCLCHSLSMSLWARQLKKYISFT